jgi:NAD(P)-dependent dehydrogenase (short-subunit alcohol dehydrogenase family)
MLLQDKVAVVYGAGGAIGRAVARAFAADGARVFLTGHTAADVDEISNDIRPAAAEARQVDATDEAAIAEHLQHVVDVAGGVDISFNAIGIPDTEILGVPLVDLDAETFARPITTYTSSYFLTARMAARHMAAKRSGVIMTVSALPARPGSTLNGGYGSAMAAKEALTRDLSAELAPAGIRVVGLRPHGMPETRTMKEVHATKTPGITFEQFERYLASTTHPHRVMTLDEVANVAVFAASDRASGLTGTTLNLTMGSVDD